MDKFNKIKYSGLAKFIATIVLTCSMVSFVGMLLVSMIYAEIGGTSNVLNMFKEKITENYACLLFTEIGYNPSNENVEQTVQDIIGGTSLDGVIIESNTHNIEDIDLKDKNIYIYGSPEAIEDGYQYYFWGIKGGSYYYNLDSVIGAITADNGCYDVLYSDSDEKYYIFLGTVWNVGCDDLYKEAEELIPILESWGKNSLFFQIISLILMLFSASYLIVAAGRRTKDEEIHLRFIDKIPFEIYSTIFWILEALAFCAYELIFEVAYGDITQMLVFGIELAIVIAFMGIAYIGTILTRIKAKKFWRYTLVYYLCLPLRKASQYARENLSLFWKTTSFLAIAFLAFLISGIMFVAMSLDAYSPGPFVFWIFVVMGLVAAGAYLIVFQMKRIQDGVERIAKGDVEHPIDTTQLVWEFKKHADNINTIGQGIDVAVQERMKSERFKTELITNVSHDIKTPLTSIINYVDLMKKEDITDPTMLEYMDVLDRQSARLKKLIEDLMEASKASTGNLAVNLEKCDISVILGQAVGEFEEKMEAKGLIPVVTYPENTLSVSVDGRHLWRVFDNLLNNICKYAQSGTRVYINVEQKDRIVEIIFKNISSTQLNISSEELMERFVRGDSSRNTEGSGLGLSIAKSLTELMNGEMILNVDGDLFKVTLKFGAV